MTTEPVGARSISASEFKAKCLKLMDEIAVSGQELVITKHGQPVSRLVPYRKRPKTLFGSIGVGSRLSGTWAILSTSSGRLRPVVTGTSSRYRCYHYSSFASTG